MSSQSTAVPKYFQTMSTAPPAPAPTNAPPSFSSHDQSHNHDSILQPSSSNNSHFPHPKLRLELRDLTHDSTDVFLKHFSASKDMETLAQTVLNLLYNVHDHQAGQHASEAPTSTTSHPAPTSATSRPAPPKLRIPDTRSVTLILRDMDGVAYTTGNDLDDDHKEIHLSLRYISHVAKGKNSIRHELLGVVCHELVHCFQWNAHGTCNGGLIEGIADWVRLNADYVPPHWRKDTDGDWDRGYQNTGYFLDWIENTHGKGSIYRLNQSLADNKYDDSKFWKTLFGDDVERLYSRYKESVEKEMVTQVKNES